VAVERLEALPLGEFCRNTVGEWQSGSSPERGIVFHMADEAKALSIRGDAFRLSQALTNLLNNAAAHTPSAGSIEFRLEATPAGEARIRIVDAGEGIPPEKLEEVFSPFYTSRRGGTGLGLNLVRRIVEQHDGTVALYNNGDRPGCTAEILLPLGCRGA
jgi:signal transduction histidine kinase